MKSEREKIQHFLSELSQDVPTHSGGRRPQEEGKDLKREEHERRLGMQRWIVRTVAILVGVWVPFVMVITVLDGAGVIKYHPSVLVTLLGSATASIIGLLMKVVSYTLPNQ